MPEKLICTKISNVMSKVGAIGKDKKNLQQGYQFRGIEDVYLALHDIMAEERIFTVPEVLEERSELKQSRSGSELIYRILKIKYRFVAEDGSEIESIVIGEGMDSGDKASNKAMSIAHKYALLQIFLVPTEDLKNPEDDSHDLTGSRKKSSSKKPAEVKTISDQQFKMLKAKITTKFTSGDTVFKDDIKTCSDKFKEHFGINETKGLPAFKMEEALKWIDEY